MLNVRASSNQPAGKNGVPAGTNADAANRKFPSPPGVSRPSAAIASAADRAAPRWTPPSGEATRAEMLIFLVRRTSSTAHGPKRASGASSVITGPTLSERSLATARSSMATSASSPAGLDQSGRNSPSGCVAARTVCTS